MVKSGPRELFETRADHQSVGVEAQQHVEVVMTERVAESRGELHPQPAARPGCSGRSGDDANRGKSTEPPVELTRTAGVVDDDDSRLGRVAKDALHRVLDPVIRPGRNDDNETSLRAHMVMTPGIRPRPDGLSRW